MRLFYVRTKRVLEFRDYVSMFAWALLQTLLSLGLLLLVLVVMLLVAGHA